MIEPEDQKAQEDIEPIREAEREEPPIFRDLLESFIFAIIMALVIKSFLAEAYKVPTGSMEPTIHGAQVNGDRILVNKFTNFVRDPRRWEIWVFGYPNNRRVNYVKRVVGVGPESISLIDGDVYTAPFGTTNELLYDLFEAGKLKIKKKPAHVQDAIFKRYPRIHPDHENWDSLAQFHEDWIIPKSALPNEEEWSYDNGIIAKAGGRSMVHFRHDIKDQRDPFSDIGPTNAYGTFEVGDLRLVFDATPQSKGGHVVLEIRDPTHDHRIKARLSIEGEDEVGSIMLSDTEHASLPAGQLKVGQTSRIEFTNVDDTVTLKINDEVIATFEYDHMPRMLAGPRNWAAGVGFGIERANVRFASTQIYRDIYYRGGGASRSAFEPAYESWRADIPAGHYYVLGDNSPASNDSREWRRKTLTFQDSDVVLHGDTMAVVDPDVLENRMSNPYTLTRETADGKTIEETFFVDEFGNKHEISRYGSLKGSEDGPSPLVPRHLFVGRAYAVFLPLERMQLVR